MTTPIRRTATVLATAAAFLVATALPAAAHVTVEPGEAEAGSYTRLDFRVPTESDDASTVKIEVNFPEDAPLPSVRTMAVAGWTAEAETRTLDEPVEVHGREFSEVVSKVTWTADDDESGIQPGEFGEFPISVGPLPESGTMIFKVIQTYSDDSEAAWIDEPNADGSEPAEPAPVLTITAAGAVDGPTPGESQAGAVEDDDDDEEDEGSALPVVLSSIALAVSAVALAVAGLLWRRRSQS